MRRRQFVASVGASTVLGLAGCTAPAEDEGADGTPVEDETASPTETDAAGATGNQTGETGTPTEELPNQVAMVTEGSDFYFDPIGLYVEPGTEITWFIQSGTHSATAWVPENPSVDERRIPEGAAAWDSGTIGEEGAEFTHTFEETGTYDYYCIPHLSLGMVGRLVVGEPGGVSGDPPHGSLPDPQAIVDQGAIGWEEFQG